jgi:hypothetical protein
VTGRELGCYGASARARCTYDRIMDDIVVSKKAGIAAGACAVGGIARGRRMPAEDTAGISPQDLRKSSPAGARKSSRTPGRSSVGARTGTAPVRHVGIGTFTAAA